LLQVVVLVVVQAAVLVLAVTELVTRFLWLVFHHSR
jgi:hypothetical protein